MTGTAADNRAAMGATTLIDPSDEAPVEQGHARPAEQAGDAADGQGPRGGVATQRRRQRSRSMHEPDHVRPQDDRGRRDSRRAAMPPRKSPTP